LRIELARTGLRDPSLFADYTTARAILLPLARLDADFSRLESLCAIGRSNQDVSIAGAVPAPAPRAFSRAR
jgi:hypothetical protein